MESIRVVNEKAIEITDKFLKRSESQYLTELIIESLTLSKYNPFVLIPQLHNLLNLCLDFENLETLIHKDEHVNFP